MNTYAVIKGAEGRVFVLCDEHVRATRADSRFEIYPMPPLPQKHCDACEREQALVSRWLVLSRSAGSD